MDWKKLAEPFPAEDIEWRIAQKGNGNKGPWAKVLAYVTNRAIMQRLDDVCGPENWRNEFQRIQGAFLCALSIRVNTEWVTKWDGAQESQIEATKGGISGAMKRAAVQWGIGRYLYNLEEGWALIGQNGRFYCPADKKNNVPDFRWDPPILPVWALPEGGHNTDTKTATEIERELKSCKSLSELKVVWADNQPHIKGLPFADEEKVNKAKDEMKSKLTPKAANQ